MPRLARINIYPVKSLDGQPVDESVLLPSGNLRFDRTYALMDEKGDPIVGKSHPAIHRLRSKFDPATRRLSLRIEGSGEWHAFDMQAGREGLAAWLGDYFGEKVEIIENPDGGFPDDPRSPGPTVVSTGTLAELARWFPGISVDEMRDRFRANLEIEADEPFWEDRLVSDGLGIVRFQIGEATLEGTDACPRCPVPTRNPRTGDVVHGFARLFMRQREETLPEWAPRGRFDDFYRLAVQTRPVHARETTLHVGDEVRVMETA